MSDGVTTEKMRDHCQKTKKLTGGALVICNLTTGQPFSISLPIEFHNPSDFDPQKFITELFKKRKLSNLALSLKLMEFKPQLLWFV